MRKLILTLITLLLSAQIYSAAPATHVVFAELWIKTNEVADPAEFIVGTLFPDIRYLGTIKRDETHEKNITLDKIRQSGSSFIAGMRLHVFVDEQRTKFIDKYGVYSKLKAIPKEHRVNFLKMLEDEILWNDCDWSRVIEMLQAIYPEQLLFVEQNIADKWHQEMIRYLQQKPSIFLQHLSAYNKGFLKADAETIKHWAIIFPEYAQDPYFIEYTQNLKIHLFSLF